MNWPGVGSFVGLAGVICEPGQRFISGLHASRADRASYAPPGGVNDSLVVGDWRLPDHVGRFAGVVHGHKWRRRLREHPGDVAGRRHAVCALLAKDGSAPASEQHGVRQHGCAAAASPVSAARVQVFAGEVAVRPKLAHRSAFINIGTT